MDPVEEGTACSGIGEDECPVVFSQHFLHTPGTMVWGRSDGQQVYYVCQWCFLKLAPEWQQVHKIAWQMPTESEGPAGQAAEGEWRLWRAVHDLTQLKHYVTVRCWRL
jgi:hypothetical protein